MKTETFIINKDQKGANVVASKGNSKGNVMITTKSGVVLFIHPSLLDEAKNSKFVSYQPAGETFIATKDSKRTKLQGWLSANPDKTEQDCPLTPEVQGEALYFAGDTHTRVGNGFQGFTNNNEISFEEKMSIMKNLGVAISL